MKLEEKPEWGDLIQMYKAHKDLGFYQQQKFYSYPQKKYFYPKRKKT